nr:zinc finger BED domain-containing protein RICESLEEPER 2-like [Ipomoea batatas]
MRRRQRPALSRSATVTSDRRRALSRSTTADQPSPPRPTTGDQPSPPRLRPATSPLRASASATTTTDQPAMFFFWNLDLCNSSKMTSPTPSVNYSGSATGINAEFDFDSEMPSSRQPEPKSPSIQEFEQPNSEEPKPKRAKSTTSDVWKSFTKIGMVDGKERARCNGCQKEYIIGGIKYGTSSLLRHIPKCVALPKYHNVGTMMLDAMLAYCYWLLA